MRQEVTVCSVTGLGSRALCALWRLVLSFFPTTVMFVIRSQAGIWLQPTTPVAPPRCSVSIWLFDTVVRVCVCVCCVFVCVCASCVYVYV